MNSVEAEQMLFGYKNGHILLASSLKRKLVGQKKIEFLSDISGNGQFDHYITCFPLLEDGYYVFAKTWYASEMQRPGCVWTHVLLVSLDDIKMNCGMFSISDAFVRPNGYNNLQKYSNPVQLGKCRDNFESSIYKYLLYTIFYSDKNVIIEENDSAVYEEALLDIILKLPEEIIQDFSACTCSMANRYLNDKSFRYQITPNGYAKYLVRDVENSVLYRSRTELDGYPLWVCYLYGKFRESSQLNLFEFCRIYEKLGRGEVKELAKIFYAVNEFESRQNLENYIGILKKVDSSEYLIEKTDDLLFCKNSFEIDSWFWPEDVIERLFIFLDNEEEKSLKGKISARRINATANELYKKRNYEKMKVLFYKYTHKRLNEDGNELVHEIIKYLKPNDLYEIFELDYKICSVLIHHNPEFLLCEQIWKENKDFQLEMLSNADVQKSNNRKNILKGIINNTRQNISEEVYDSFNKELLQVIFELARNRKMNKQQIQLWVPCLTKDKDLYIEILSVCEDPEILIALMQEIDSYSISDERQLNVWITAITRMFSELKKDDGYKRAIFILPLILKYSEPVSEQVLEFVYTEIYQKLEKSEMEYSYWKKIDPLLPEVDVEQCWDKCLRLKMAFAQKFNIIL